jgi:hypothetical protein
MKVHSFRSFNWATMTYSCWRCDKQIDARLLDLNRPDLLACDGPDSPAERIESNISEAVEGMVEAANQPMSVRVSIDDYRALLARNGLEPRSLRLSRADTLRAKVHGFDLPVDADARVPNGDAWVYAREPEVGRA